MPTNFTKEGFRFFFYSNEHRPSARAADLTLQELRRAEELVLENRALILRSWHEHLG